MKHHGSPKGISLDNVDCKLFPHRTSSIILDHSSAFKPVLSYFHKTKALRNLIARRFQNVLTVAHDKLC